MDPGANLLSIRRPATPDPTPGDGLWTAAGDLSGGA